MTPTYSPLESVAATEIGRAKYLLVELDRFNHGAKASALLDVIKTLVTCIEDVSGCCTSREHARIMDCVSEANRDLDEALTIAEEKRGAHA